MLARLTLATALALAGAAHATPADRARVSHDVPTALGPAAGVSKSLRTTTHTVDGAVGDRRDPAWQRFAAALPGLTQGSWDEATRVPSRLWGRGLDVPGASADPAIAAAAARAVLAAHVAVLAPGSRPEDFVLVANHVDAATGQRSIGFAQHHGGLPVVGGQVSFRFKRDRLFVIGSEALPGVAVAWPRAAKRATELAPLARDALAADLGLAPTALAATTTGVPAILPLVGDGAVLGYRVALAVDVDGGKHGAWRVWADPATGGIIVRQSTTPSATGTIVLDVVDRYPARPRQTMPAARMSVTVDGATLETDADGRLTWPAAGAANVTLRATGPDIAMTNVADANRAPTPFTATLAPDGTLTWSPGTDRALDAQISAFAHATLVRRYARRFAPDLAFLDETLPVRVNIDDECNAFSDGTAINFFAESARCENTATLADVVYHEFGHSVHRHAIIPGVGAFDGAFSEGLSDYLAATITGDSGMGRGFFRNDAPLRELNPVGSENVWPRDIGEIHRTGIIFGGAMWDLRTALVEARGADAGVRYADQLFYAAVQRATNIRSTVVELLAADDDDGDLTNGTPNECLIRAAFARHGLRTLAGAIEAPSAITSGAPAARAGLTLTGVDHRCDDVITAVTVEWREGGIDAGSVTATAGAADDTYTAELPLPADGATLWYRYRVSFANGTEATFPDNRADPWLQLYRGDLVPLYCTDFETNPFTSGWRVGGDGADTWQWGQPGAQPNVGDPGAAYSGTKVVGTGLSFVDGSYRPDALAWLESPTIDVGAYSDVRLQYRRWLTIEDGFYDHAVIEVNGEPAWANLTSQGSSSHTTHHEDRGWRFHDVALSSRIYDGTVTLRWSLEADRGLEFGGWTLDDVCVVANPRSVCGDGVRSPTEQCDDGAGNGTGADLCRPSCRFAECGDGIVDSGEACDDGDDDDTDGCNVLCEVIEDRDDEVEGGCATGGGRGPGGAVALGLALAALVRRRRR